mgnify:CR=1 FL=1
MQYGKVEICGINTSELKVLGEKEKMDLLRKAQAGDKQARDALICGNLRLVLSVIQRFSGRGESMDDLFQVGVIGLIKAIDHFNTELNVKFSTYAVPMCVGEVRRFLRDDNPVRVSRSMRDTAYKAMQVKEQLMAANGREPTVDEIAAKLGMKTTDVVLALEAIVDPVSLYEPVYSDGGDTIYVMDQIGDKNSESDWMDEIVFREAMKNLGDREKQILSLRWTIGSAIFSISALWRAKPKWRWRLRSASARHRSADWKKPPCAALRANR